MPRNKDLKRLVRTRMKKTGEAYTAARAQITRKRHGRTAGDSSTSSAIAPSPPPDHAALAGMSDSTIKKNTGRAWAEWVEILDGHGAPTMPHGEIASIVHTRYDVSGWWSQSVTVGYERIKGLRARGQRRDGSYEASKSRTFNVAVDILFDAWADAKKRRRWLPDPGVKIRTATASKSMRIAWSDGTIVAVGFYPKGKGKSSVAVQHTKLPDRETADRLKQLWAERMEELRKVVDDE